LKLNIGFPLFSSLFQLLNHNHHPSEVKTLDCGIARFHQNIISDDVLKVVPVSIFVEVRSQRY
jgi:hypothetical protein